MYKRINKMIQLLYTNAVTIPSTSVGGTHRHIRLIMKPYFYSTLSEIPYTVPVNPDPIPT